MRAHTQTHTYVRTYKHCMLYSTAKIIVFLLFCSEKQEGSKGHVCHLLKKTTKKLKTEDALKCFTIVYIKIPVPKTRVSYCADAEVKFTITQFVLCIVNLATLCSLMSLKVTLYGPVSQTKGIGFSRLGVIHFSIFRSREWELWPPNFIWRSDQEESRHRKVNIFFPNLKWLSDTVYDNVSTIMSTV